MKIFAQRWIAFIQLSVSIPMYIDNFYSGLKQGTFQDRFGLFMKVYPKHSMLRVFIMTAVLTISVRGVTKGI